MYCLPISSEHGKPGVLHFADVFAVLIENLDSLILAIGHPQQALGVDGDPVRDVELAGLGSFSAPGLDELAVLVELEDARIAFPGAGRVALGDEQISVGAEDDIVGLVEKLRSGSFIPLARLALGAEREKHLALAGSAS